MSSVGARNSFKLPTKWLARCCALWASWECACFRSQRRSMAHWQCNHEGRRIGTLTADRGGGYDTERRVSQELNGRAPRGTTRLQWDIVQARTRSGLPTFQLTSQRLRQCTGATHAALHLYIIASSSNTKTILDAERLDSGPMHEATCSALPLQGRQECVTVTTLFVTHRSPSSMSQAVCA
jgi:hypothetical protein